MIFKTLIQRSLQKMKGGTENDRYHHKNNWLFGYLFGHFGSNASYSQ
jgi:hypothetical protein